MCIGNEFGGLRMNTVLYISDYMHLHVLRRMRCPIIN